MYHVLIVEDEPIERIALRTELEYGNYGIEEIYEADNGEKALELYRAKRPEILIVDINIPVLSGLDLIQALTAEGSRGKILITTAYDKSKYVRKALSLGVIGYLVKPIQGQELREGIEKCRAMLDEERERAGRLQSVYTYSKGHVLRDALSGAIEKSAVEKFCGWPPTISPLMCIMAWYPIRSDCGGEAYDAEKMFEALFGGEFYILSAELDGMLVAMLRPSRALPAEEAAAVIHVYSEALYQRLSACQTGCLFVSGPMEELDQVQNYYAIICGEQRGVRRGRLIRPSIPSGGLCASQDRFKLRQKWIQKFGTQTPEQIVNSVKRKLQQPNAYWAGACLFIEAFSLFDEGADTLALFSCFCSAAPYDALQDFLKNYALTSHQRDLDADHAHKLIDTALEIMHRRFADNLSQAEIAEDLGLNQAYFSTLFKRVTGDTFSNTLNAIRLRHAMELIRLGERDMDAVARDSGYGNKKYFYSVFRRKTGKTVAEYVKAVEQG